MSDLEVRASTLEEIRDSLDALIDEFSAASSRVEGDREDVGASSLADALHDFVDNWGRHRHELLESLTGLRDATQATLDAFGDVETHLAGALTPTDSGPGGVG